MIPPTLMRLVVYEKGQKKFNMWFPLILIYLLLLPLFLLALPFLLVGGLVLWLFGGGRTPFSLWVALYELWCASKGIIIETKSKDDRVLIRIF
ncbi:hypothetical protein [Bdellovibrio sp. HCB337]|uniref:hypothetical protein n=1 Tax=Bdellovibrio sp. HCB337 TaxID=3394358 RepID=UPI0039A6ABF4